MSLNFIIVLSFVALVLGMIGSVAPVIPGPFLSLAGVYIYWWGRGFMEPTLTLLVVITLVALLAVLVDWFGPALASRMGGASNRTAVIAGLVGFVGLFVAGPLGMIVSVFLSALVLEYYRQRNLKDSGRAALASLLGAVGAPLIQLLVTFSILVSMVFVYVF